MENDHQEEKKGFRLYVGNLAWATTTESLRETFEKFGTVTDSIVVSDRFSGRSKGFGFVTFDSESDANAAIEAMNESDLDGRNVRVNMSEDRPRAPREGGNWRDRGEGGRDGDRRGGFRGGRGGRGGSGGRGGRGGFRGGRDRPYERREY